MCVTDSEPVTLFLDSGHNRFESNTIQSDPMIHELKHVVFLTNVFLHRKASNVDTNHTFLKPF